jgi:hypothetical protein
MNLPFSAVQMIYILSGSIHKVSVLEYIKNEDIENTLSVLRTFLIELKLETKPRSESTNEAIQSLEDAVTSLEKELVDVYSRLCINQSWWSRMWKLSLNANNAHIKRISTLLRIMWIRKKLLDNILSSNATFSNNNMNVAGVDLVDDMWELLSSYTSQRSITK